MPRKVVRKTAPRRRRALQGGSIFSGIGKALKGVAKFIKKHRILSRAGSVGSMLGIPYVGTAGKVASMAGYGRKKRIGGSAAPSGGRRCGGSARPSGAGRGKATRKQVFP